MIRELLLVGLGGGVGSIFRYLTSRLLIRGEMVGFPWATFTVNLFGCLFIGLLVGLSVRWMEWNEGLKLLLITGFCGGFTTFSAFSLENLTLYQQGNYSQLILYTLGSVVCGLLAVWGGMRIVALPGN